MKPFRFIIVICLGMAGCVERTLTVESNPPGAVVSLDDQEIGRTPLSRDFTWYGKYDVAVRKDGFETVKTVSELKPPVYQWVPLDLLAELLPIHFHDQQKLTYSLVPQSADVDTVGLLDRAEQLKGDLQGDGKATSPTTKPSHKKTASK